MYVIDRFTTQTPHGKYQWEKQNVLSLICFFTLEQTTKIKICHMVATEHPELIEGRRRLIATDVIDYEEAVEYGLIDNSGSDQDEQYDSGLGETGVRTGVT